MSRLCMSRIGHILQRVLPHVLGDVTFDETELHSTKNLCENLIKDQLFLFVVAVHQIFSVRSLSLGKNVTL